jgi:hypothetical protein
MLVLTPRISLGNRKGENPRKFAQCREELLARDTPRYTAPINHLQQRDLD